MDTTSPIRLLLSGELSFGPGKAELLEKIRELGSVHEAAVAMEMSYMKAWKIVKGLNARFHPPLVAMHRGGRDQGGAELTATGAEILKLYREATAAAEKAVASRLGRMRRLLADHEPNSPGSGPIL